MKKILIVEDDVTLNKLLEHLFKREGFEVMKAFNGQEGYDKATQIPDVIVSDVMMPKMDGYEMLSKIRKDLPYIPVIMLTAKNQDEDELEAFNYEADDYIAKPFNNNILIARVNNLLKNNDQVSNVVILKNKYFDLKNGRLFKDSQLKDEIALTQSESDILKLLVNNKDNNVSKDKIAYELWGNNDDKDKMINAHMKNLRKKLGESSEVIKTIYRVGYRLEL